MKLNRIKAVLLEKGISQTWLAKKLDKSFSMVNAYACNRIQPNLETLQEIAEILQVDLQAVDNLTVSGFLIEMARKHIEGEISMDEVNKMIEEHYAQKRLRND